MVYEMRKLQAKDIIPFTNLISKIKVKDIAACFGKDRLTRIIENVSKEKAEDEVSEDNDDFVETIGYDVVLEVVDVILINLPDCEQPLFDFLANITGQKAETIKSMELSDFIEQIKAFIQKDELKDFTKVAAKLIK